MYDKTTTVLAQSSNGLSNLTDRLSEARNRISGVAIELDQIAISIHGPRPRAVSTSEAQGVKGPDSIRDRIDELLREIGNLESAAQEIVR